MLHKGGRKGQKIRRLQLYFLYCFHDSLNKATSMMYLTTNVSQRKAKRSKYTSFTAILSIEYFHVD